MRTFEEFITRLKFLKKHAQIILVFFLIFTAASFAGLTWIGLRSDSRVQPYNIFAHDKLMRYHAAMITYSPSSFVRDTFRQSKDEQYETFRTQWLKVFKEKALFDLSLSAIVSFILICVVLALISKRDRGLRDESFLRGASFVMPSFINSAVKKSRIVLGREKLHFPRSFENMGLFLFGAPGSGKSTLIKHFIPQVASDSAIIYDRKPEFFPLYYNATKDLLLDPKDKRSIRWNLFNEIHEKEDIDSVVGSLIPLPPDPKSAFWYQAARDIFKAIFLSLRESGCASNKTLIDFLYSNGCNRERLYRALKDDPRVEGYLGKDNNTANSIMAVVSQFANSLVQRHFYHEGDFSVREFIKGGAGRLFVVNRIATEEAFQTYYTLFLDLAFREFLNRSIDRNFRFWFIIDEFPTLMKLETLQRLLAEGRDRGSCPILGAQDFEQVKKVYGADAYSIFNQTNSKIIFRVNDPNTTDYLSRAFGDQEHVKHVKTLTAGIKQHRDGYSFSDQQIISRLILPSELRALSPLRGYVSIGEYPITQISLDIVDMPARNSSIPAEVTEIMPNRKQEFSGAISDELLT